MNGDQIINLSAEQKLNITPEQFYQMTTVNNSATTLTFNDILGSFRDTFILRMELFVLVFFAFMIFLQWYERDAKRHHRLMAILHDGYKVPHRDELLFFLSDLLFLPSVAFVLIFVGYETGWWI